jgi:hypothetical protein
MHICQELIKSVPVFQACRPTIIRCLVPSLVHEVYPPGEVIFNQVGFVSLCMGGGWLVCPAPAKQAQPARHSSTLIPACMRLLKASSARLQYARPT